MAVTKVSSSLIDANLTISGGTIDDTVIGSGTPAAGTFTTISGTLASSVTGTTQSAGDGSTKIATTAYADAAAAAVVDSAPSTLDTLNELAAALGDDANFSTTVTNSIAAKAPIANPTFTGSFTSPGIDDNANAIAITIDSSENVGIGAAPDTSNYGGTLRYFGVDAGAGYAVIEGQTSSVTAGDGAASFFASTTGSSGLKLLGGMQVYNYASSSSNAEGGLKFFTASGGNIPARMTIDNSGNVGIGTSSPSTKLHLGGTAPGDSIIRQDSTASGTNWEIGERAAGKWQIFEDDTDSIVATFTSSGNVGVGVGDPAYKLQVQDTTAASTSNYISVVSGNQGNAGIIFGDSDSDTRGGVLYNNADDALRFFKSGFSEAMRIDNSGNLGIGTDSPTASYRASIKGDFSSIIGGIEFDNGGGNKFTIGHASATSPSAILNVVGSGNLVFKTVNQEVARFTTTGRLGVGEDSPEGLMHIKKGNSGTSYSADAADQLILENSGSVVMDIRTPDGDTGGILFSNGTDGRGRGIIQYAHSGDTMYFNTGGAARFQMNENSCQSLLSFVAGSATYADDPLYAIRSDTGKLIRLYQGTTEVGYISTNTYSLPSDRNFKKDIEDLPLGLELVKSLQPKQYRQKIDEHNSPLQAGLIAQDFEEALTAQGVESNKYIMLQETPNDDETQSQYAVDYVKLIPVLINAIQEQQTLIESLTARIEELENN